MDEHTNKKHTQQKVIPFIGLGILLLLLVLVVARKGNFSLTGGPKPTPTPSQPVVAGRMYLTSPGNQQVFHVGDTIALDLRVDTLSQEIGGYDAVIHFDNTTIEFVKAENLVKDFDMFNNVIKLPGDTGETLTLTGIMKLETQTPFVFNQEPIARLTFKAKKVGPAPLTFKFEKGETNDSNLVLINTEEVLGEVQNFDLSIGNGRTLKEGGAFTDPASGATIKVDRITIPEPQCNDCTIDAIVTVTLSSGEMSTLTFSNGGIAGQLVDTKKVSGLVLEVSNITEKSLELSVSSS